jgi:SAM-dependent methyltransferase
MNEIEDSPLFNSWFSDVASGMLYDMSYIQKYYVLELPLPFKQISKNSVFLDIGSGAGEASSFHLQQFFGKDVKIILSDLHPKTELWKKLENDNISYIKEPVDATDLSNIKEKYSIVSCFGSFHHMDEKTIQKIFFQIRKEKKQILIVEPRRFPNALQFLHILILPVFGFASYNLISLFGSAITNSNLLTGITRFLLIPFFMTWDHILGASRRYHPTEIQMMGNENGLKMVHYADLVFDYYILQP